MICLIGLLGLAVLNPEKLNAQCVPTVGVTGATGDYINNFSFGTLSNLGSGDDPNDYTLFPNTGSYVQGLPYTFTIQTGSPTWPQSVGVWIDLNGNTLFTDPGEFVYVSGALVTSATTLTASYTIPILTPPGVKRMRVCSKYNTTLASTESCGITTFGEYEDYNITILANTPCAGTPVAGTSGTTAVNPVCPGTNVCFTLTGSSLTGGLAYQWLQGVNCAPPWTPISGITNPSALTPNLCVQTVGGTTIGYRCRVTCTNSGLSDTSTSTCVVTQSWSCTSPCYQASSATNAADQDIFNVTYGSLNNTTNCATPLVGSQGPGIGTGSMYADFSVGVAAPAIYKGLSTPFSVNVGSCGGNVNSSVKIFIDFNHNSVFTDPGETVYDTVNVAVPVILNGNITVPASALIGCTKMRVVMMSTWIGTVNPTGTYGYGETEDYSINIIQPSPHDPAITAINVPPGTCFTNNETVTATLANYGSSTINLATNPVTVSLNVNSPIGLLTYSAIANTGILNPYGVNNVTLTFTGVNLYPGGAYSINTSLTISGLINGNTINDSLNIPVSRLNYRPTGGPNYNLCQGNIIPFGQGLSVSGCATPIQDSVDIIFTLAPGQPPICTSSIANPTGACEFATAVLPMLPAGSTINSPATLTVTNLASAYLGCIICTWPVEKRFSLFQGTAPPTTPGSTFWPGAVGNTATTGANAQGYTYTNLIDSTVMGTIYSVIGGGGTLKMGSWNTYNTTASTHVINYNGNPTIAKIRLRYTYVPASFEWYKDSVGGPVLYTYSPFNPIGVPGSGISNSNTPGTYPFYAACAGSSACRVPVNLVINPVPSVFQDTLSACEFAVGSNNAVFDLTTLDGPVSAFAPGTSVSYFGDQALFLPVPNPTMDTSSTNFVYSKVTINATGCYSSDSVYLDVNSVPQFTSSPLLGNACAPSSIDVASLINPFTTTAGADTLYYDDATYTTLHPNPHAIFTPDTVYMVLATNTVPVCSDTAMAIINITPASNFIAYQDTLGNYSNCGVVGCGNILLTDGNTETLYTTTDCRKIATVTDALDGVNLGSVNICEDIDCSVQTHNGQPYVNRHYQITPTTNDSALVCLYFLDQDFADYNATAFTLSPPWPLMNPGSNLCISKVDNGDINTPGHTAVSIPNSAITTAYDPITTVWTICFPVSGFSTFYCHTCNPLNIALPVELLHFGARKAGSSSLVEWTTIHETNNAYFVVERSTDARSFTAISGKIPTQAMNGNSQVALNYQFNDLKPENGYNYYRLRQSDIDGNISYSQVADVFFGVGSSISMYPNPTHSELNISVSGSNKSLARIRLNDATGRLVRTIEWELTEGNNLTQIDLSDLSDGVYLIRIEDNKGLNFTGTINKN